MGRINANDYDKFAQNTSDSEWLKLSNDGDMATVQFMYHSVEELDTFTCHKIKVGDKERYVSCLRDYDDPVEVCPLCAKGDMIKPVFMIAMYDIVDKKVKIWERSSKKFRDRMITLINRYGDLTKRVFDIERHGAAGSKETTYDIFPLTEEDLQRRGLAVADLSEVKKPDFIGGFILDKNAEEMNAFINTGEFPQTANADNRPPVNNNNNTQQFTRRGAASNSTSRRGEAY